MINMYAGMNGQGKTLYLSELQQRLLDKQISCISNIKEGVMYKGLDTQRVDIITSEEAIINAFDYSDIIATSNHIASVSKEDPLSEEYTSLLTLLARNGDVLLLDEPDFLLSSWEIVSFINILCMVKDTYKDIHIVTHNQRLLGAAERIFWMDGYEVREISEEELYEHVGKI